MNPSPFVTPWRVGTLYSLMAISIIAFTGQLLRLQVIQHEEFSALAIENRQARINAPAQRGVIYDRNGIILAHNIPSYDVVITPAELPEDDLRLQEIYQRIATVTGAPINTPPLDAGNASRNRIGEDAPPPGITEVVFLQESIAPYESVVVAPNVDRTVALTLSEELRNLPGVGIQITPMRDYPTGALTSHVIGYMGPITEAVKDFYSERGFDASRDKIGYSGVEAFMQDTLAGQNGSKLIEQDVAGLELRVIGEVKNPIPGRSIMLTIDTQLQAISEAALRQRMKIENQSRDGQPVTNGVVISMNPQTGEILSMVSLPNYDNQQFARYIPVDYYTELLNHPHKPLLNQAISGEHPPGSVYKLVVASGALQEEIVTPEQFVDDPGEIEIVNRYFPNDPGKTRKVVCWKRDGHGPVDFMTGIAQSCDVYFYALGGGYEEGGVTNGLGIDKIFQYSEWLGYNQITGIELPGELSGLIPNRDWKRINIGENWSTGDTYISSIGQGYVLSTPLQVLNSFTPFINKDGALMKPTIIRNILDGEGNVVKEFQPQIIHQTPIKRSIIEKISLALRKVMVDGTGEKLEELNGVTIAGKTGTAEYCDNIAQEAGRCKFGAWPAHAWFVGYGPYENPEIAVVAFVYSGEEGSTVAGPIVMEIMDAYFELEKLK
ncbi:MAG: penicillin-binding protein 2 [Anaerolineaceae bacterium]|nr:penicillin-binding protein 2 [Anaerolineaceae bacterium]|tara:strand:+ start:53805 stop:55793 length:1989 start_codon:yes stop_codon:yes gene_type:complete